MVYVSPKGEISSACFLFDNERLSDGKQIKQMIYFTSPLLLITCERLRLKGGITSNVFYAIEKVGRLVGGIL